jgi:hypothetical protein
MYRNYGNNENDDKQFGSHNKVFSNANLTLFVLVYLKLNR